MPCYFFSGASYIRVTRSDIGPGSVDPNYPAPISLWGWGDFGANGIDAALYSGTKCYFFSGNRYIRVTRGRIGPGTVDPGYPAPISNWGWGSFGASGIDAALYSGSKCYFFSGNRYIRVTRGDEGPGTVDPGYPAPISNWGWGNFGANGIDAALYSGPRCYFFSGNRYIRVTRGDEGPGTVDPGYPAPISIWNWGSFGANGIKGALFSGLDPVTTLRVLVVADRADYFSFSTTPDATDNQFTMTRFVAALRSTLTASPNSVGLSVTLAHRDLDPGIAGNSVLLPKTVQKAVFTWNSASSPSPGTVVDLSQFDVVLLFGVNVENGSSTMLRWDGSAAETQLWAFAEFMNAGRGIFATGDHEDFGAALCGSIPRVRSMRRWWWQPSPYNPNNAEGPYGQASYGLAYAQNKIIAHPDNRAPYNDLGDICAPPSVGPWRIDTLQGPIETVHDPDAHANETGISFDRQSDDVPQAIALIGSPHPIFAMSGGRYLTHMPDHMHEGRVIDINDFVASSYLPRTQTFDHQGATMREYPTTAQNVQPLPQIVATSRGTSHLTPTTESEHTGALDASNVATNGTVCVYDGSAVGVGRIVTQSTFHHFFDINIIGDPGNATPNDARRLGFRTAAGAAYLQDFEQYWRNIILWLAHQNAAHLMLASAIAAASRNASIRMAARPEMSADGNALHDVGAVAAQGLDRQLPTPMLADLVHRTLPEDHKVIAAEMTQSLRQTSAGLAIHARRRLTHGFLGGAVLRAVSADTPTTSDGKLHPELMSAAVQGATRSLATSGHAAIIAPWIERLATRVSANAI